MFLTITTPIFYLGMEIKKWLFGLDISFEKDCDWIVNFAIGYRYLIVWSHLGKRLE